MKCEIQDNLNIYYIGYIDKDNTFIIESFIKSVNILELNHKFETKNFLNLIKNNKEKHSLGYYNIYKDINNKKDIIGNYYELKSNTIINKDNNLLDKENNILFKSRR